MYTNVFLTCITFERQLISQAQYLRIYRMTHCCIATASMATVQVVVTTW